jgi:hypothetical protein
MTYLTVVFQPLGSDSRDGVVLLSGAAGHSSEGLGSSLTHRGKKRGVGLFSQRGRLLCDIKEKGERVHVGMAEDSLAML